MVKLLARPKGSMTRHMNWLDVTALVLVIIGALNWGFVAIAEYDLVAALFGLDFGETSTATRVVYGLVGIAGLFTIWTTVKAGQEATQRQGASRSM